MESKTSHTQVSSLEYGEAKDELSNAKSSRVRALAFIHFVYVSCPCHKVVISLPFPSLLIKKKEKEPEVQEIELTEGQSFKLSSRRTHLARALTSRSTSQAVLSLVTQEAEENMPEPVQEFAEAVFKSFADPETNRLDVEGALTDALKLMGHNTNRMALKDICVRFHLEYPHHHHETEQPAAAEKSGGPSRSGTKPRRLQSRDEESDEDSSTRVSVLCFSNLSKYICPRTRKKVAQYKNLL